MSLLEPEWENRPRLTASVLHCCTEATNTLTVDLCRRMRYGTAHMAFIHNFLGSMLSIFWQCLPALIAVFKR